MNTTPFEYLLNAMELAASKEQPAKHGYAEKRRAVLDYVATVARIAEAREEVIVAMRSRVGVDGALARVSRAEERLGRMMADHHARVSESR